jgi:hypothetical protein
LAKAVESATSFPPETASIGRTAATTASGSLAASSRITIAAV